MVQQVVGYTGYVLKGVQSTITSVWSAVILSFSVPVIILGVELKLLTLVVAAIALDTFTGIVKSLALNSRPKGMRVRTWLNKEIKSSKLKNMFIKFCLYSATILASYMLSLVSPEYLKIHSLVVMTLIFVEIKSIFENIAEAGGPIPKSTLDWIKKIVSK